MLNILRAHQGRQTIISALDEQAARKNRQAEELEKGIEEIMAELRARNIDITEVERQAKMIDDGADDDDDDCESR